MPSRTEIANPIESYKSKTTLSIAIGFLLIYLTWLYALIGIRIDHINFIIFLVVAYFASAITRKFVLGFIFFWIFWILYDSMRIYPNYLINDIHILEPYEWEKLLFGINLEEGSVTLNEYFAQNTSKLQDFLAGFFYLTWVPAPMLFCLYLFFTDKKMLIKFGAVFLFTNLVGFLIYYLYPAAPPWYVEYHGLEQSFDIPGNAAQLLRFDDIINYPLFENMYNKNANVFAAIPSLHAAYPVVLFYFGIKLRKNWLTALLVLDVIGIWFAAIYSMHHYFIDVLLGAFCAIIAIFVFEKLLMKTKIRQFIDNYAHFIR